MSTEPVVIDSARKHEVTDEAMLHAVRNYITSFNMGDGMTMLIGPDHTGRLLEVGVLNAEDTLVIAHPMPARRKFLR